MCAKGSFKETGGNTGLEGKTEMEGQKRTSGF